MPLIRSLFGGSTVFVSPAAVGTGREPVGSLVPSWTAAEGSPSCSRPCPRSSSQPRPCRKLRPSSPQGPGGSSWAQPGGSSWAHPGSAWGTGILPPYLPVPFPFRHVPFHPFPFPFQLAAAAAVAVVLAGMQIGNWIDEAVVWRTVEAQWTLPVIQERYPLIITHPTHLDMI